MTPDDYFRRYLVYLKYRTLNLMPLMVYPRVLLPPIFIILACDSIADACSATLCPHGVLSSSLSMLPSLGAVNCLLHTAAVMVPVSLESSRCTHQVDERPVLLGVDRGFDVHLPFLVHVGQELRQAVDRCLHSGHHIRRLLALWQRFGHLLHIMMSQRQAVGGTSSAASSLTSSDQRSPARADASEPILIGTHNTSACAF